MKFLLSSLVMFACFLSAGCAEMDVPNTKQILRDPFGEGSLKAGMSKNRVRDVYGEPDIIDTVTAEGWNEPREQWFYRAKTNLPVGAGYLSDDLYLYFDGDNLTNISRNPLGKLQGDGYTK